MDCSKCKRPMKNYGTIIIGIKERDFYACDACSITNYEQVKKSIEKEIAEEILPVMKKANSLLSYN